MEIQNYRNKWGWTTATLESCDNPELIANGVEFVVWNHSIGSPTYHTNRWDAELHAELLATHNADFAI